MYLDMRKSFGATMKMAAVGMALLPLLNSLRIAATIWLGFNGGLSLFWTIHDWLGYAIFFSFYVATLLTYSKLGQPCRPQQAAWEGSNSHAI
jgi:exosortase/archaeosortase family protein